MGLVGQSVCRVPARLAGPGRFQSECSSFGDDAAKLGQRAAGQTLLEEPFAINASDETESDVRPKPIALGSGKTLQAGGSPDLVPMNREIWMWLIPPALLLLLVEWFWFHRKS